MAAGRSITGKLDVNYWTKQINKSKSKSDAINTISDMMSAAGHLGVSDNDQKAIVTALQTYGNKYGTDGLDRIYSLWDPSKNHVNALDVNNYKKVWTDIANNPNINYTGGSVQNPYWREDLIEAKKRADSKAGTWEKYSFESKEPTVSVAPLTEQEQQTVNVGGGGNPYKDLYDALKEDFDARNKRLDEVEAQLAELTRPKTAREIAEELAIDYNEQNLLNMYNEDTNTFYDDMIKAQNETRDQYLRNNSQYVNQLTRDYLDSYKYAAPTAIGKAAKAANVLASNLYASQDNSSNDTGMLQSVNALEEARKAELAMNPYTAKNYYTQMGTALANASATRNYTDVLQYQNKSNALAQIDAANRAANIYNAQAAATKYSGLAGAQGTTASGAGTNSYLRNLYDLVYNTTNKNKTETAKTIYSILSGGS